MLTFRFCLLGLAYSEDSLDIDIKMDNISVYQGPVKITHNRTLETTFVDDSQVLAEFDWSTDNLTFPRSMNISIEVLGSTSTNGIVVQDLGIACPYLGPEELKPTNPVVFAPCVIVDPTVQSKSNVKINGIDYGFYLSGNNNLNGPWKYPVESTKTITWVYQNFMIDDDLIAVAQSLQ